MGKNKKGINDLENKVEADDLASTMVNTDIGPRKTSKGKK